MYSPIHPHDFTLTHSYIEYASQQDLFEAFGLGGDQNRISSVDADGIAMAALPVPPPPSNGTQVLPLHAHYLSLSVRSGRVEKSPRCCSLALDPLAFDPRCYPLAFDPCCCPPSLEPLCCPLDPLCCPLAVDPCGRALTHTHTHSLAHTPTSTHFHSHTLSFVRTHKHAHARALSLAL